MIKIKPVVFGISGVATAGKDLFASILVNQLKSSGFKVSRYALADALKKDCDEFCKEKFGFSAYTQIPEQKLIIRPFLVWYGGAQRTRTEGKYWRDIVQSKLEKDDSNFSVITDIRYAHYPKDEIQWIKEDCNGIVVHVTRWTESKDGGISVVPPANDHEALNDPKVKALADYCVNWEHAVTTDPICDPILNKYVSDFLKISARNTVV
jgi:hypothetical protein